MKNLKQLFAVLLIALMFSGCALIDRINREDVTTKFTVQYATLSMVERSSQITNEDVIEHINRVREVIDQDTEITVALIIAEAESYIPWESLNRADKLLVTTLLIAVSDELEDRVGAGTLDPERQLTVLTMLNWIEEAAQIQ